LRLALKSRRSGHRLISRLFGRQTEMRGSRAERLAKRDVKPDLILSSPAMRALKTAEIIAKKLDYRRKDIVVDGRLYAVGADELLDVIHKRQAGARDAVWP
jgi:phosphohistidine phosphatase SixA